MLSGWRQNVPAMTLNRNARTIHTAAAGSVKKYRCRATHSPRRKGHDTGCPLRPYPGITEVPTRGHIPPPHHLTGAQFLLSRCPTRSTTRHRPEGEMATPEMPYRTLGATGERVSAIGLGGWHLGLKHVDAKL